MILQLIKYCFLRTGVQFFYVSHFVPLFHVPIPMSGRKKNYRLQIGLLRVTGPPTSVDLHPCLP